MSETTFQVNTKTCIRCGLCIRDCLWKIIEMGDAPFMAPENRGKCIHCGHCQAICPTASITLDGHPSSALEEMRKPLDEKSVEQLLKGRRSVREYAGEEVEAEKLKRIIELASYSPTAVNARQICYLVINGRSNVEKLLQATISVMQKRDFMTAIVRDTLSGWDRIFRGAPCVLVACAPAKSPLAASDCATALGALELILPSFGLASCWAGFFTIVCGMETPQGLPVPEGCKVYGGLMIGKPAITYKRIPFRSRPEIDWVEL